MSRTRRKQPEDQRRVPTGTPPAAYVRGSAHQELAPGQPDVTVVLSGRAYLWLWRMAEAKYLVLDTSPSSGVLPELGDTMVEALEALRVAGGHGPVEAVEEASSRRRVVRRRH